MGNKEKFLALVTDDGNKTLANIKRRVKVRNMIKTEKSERGFAGGKFTDSYGEECSIKKSSAAMDDYIWLGVEKPKLIIFEDESRGKYIETQMPKTFMVGSQMHLSREQVAELLPLLQKFVDTGELE